MKDNLLLFLQNYVLYDVKVRWITLGEALTVSGRCGSLCILVWGTSRTIIQTSGSPRKWVVWLVLPTKVTLFDSTNRVMLCSLRLDLGFFYYISHNEQQYCVPFFYWLYVPHQRAIKWFYFQLKINVLLRIIKIHWLNFFLSVILNTKRNKH